MKKFLISCLLVANLSGCGSILNFDMWDDGPKIYGGVQIDAEGRAWSQDVIGYMDLPFSFVVDTALLPFYFGFEFFR